MTSRERWVQRTREAVARAMNRESIPVNAAMLEDNLDITTYMPSLGFVDRRSRGEVAAALRWLVSQGYAKEVNEAYPGEFKECGMPSGQAYELTRESVEFIDKVVGVFATQRHE